MKTILYSSLFAMLLLGSCQYKPTSDQNVEKSVAVKSPPPVATENSKPKREGNVVYNFISMENPPTYPGGMRSFYETLSKNIKYPQLAMEKGISGSVFISFIIETDGSIIDVKVDRGLGAGTDEEAVRVLKLVKKWNPGKQNGQPVRVAYQLPIKFTQTSAKS